MASTPGAKSHTTVNKRRTLGILAILTAVLLPAAIAWACTPQAQLRLDKTSYTAGDQMRVTGSDFKPQLTLTLKLDSGDQLGSVTTDSTGAFATTITAPSAAGSYILRAYGYEADGTTLVEGLPKSASFSVTRAAPATGAPSRPGATAPSQDRFAEPEVPKAKTKGFSAPGRGSPRLENRATRGGARAVGRTGALNAGAGVIKSSGRAVFAGSVPRANRAAVASKAGPRAAKRAASRERAATPSDASTTAWPGLASATAPSLAPGDEGLEGGASSQLGWGIALLALGLVALVGGIAVAGLRRRKAVTH